MAFTPLDSNFIFSTIVSEGPDVVATWVLLLASKDKFHESELQAPAVAKLLGIPVERADAAFQCLSSPDARSRHREYDGRRIMRQPSGTWLIVTGDKYQERASRAAAEARKTKYERNRAARLANSEASAFICEKYGCTKEASATVAGKRICSAHAMDAEHEPGALG
jgi:hypothetical protein